MNARKRVLGWGAWFRTNITGETIKGWGASLGLIAVLLRGESRQNTADKNVAEVVVANETRSVASEQRSLANEARLDSLIRAMRKQSKRMARVEEKVAEEAKPTLASRTWSWMTGWIRRG